MKDYKSGSHTVWDCKYYLVWVTKYRYPVLGGDVGQRCRELLREISRSHELTVYAGAINRDHVHMLIGIPPQLSVSRESRLGLFGQLKLPDKWVSARIMPPPGLGLAC